jgi:hypothetical protein
MTIHTLVGLAVDDANAQARELSRKRQGLIMAVVTKDRSGVFIAWATPEQIMADNDTECGWWKGGRKQTA